MLMLILFLPFIGVVLGKIFPKKFFIFIASLIAFIEVLLTAYLPLLFDETNKTIFELGDILFLCDEIGLIFAIISSFIAFLIFIYSFGYFKEEEKDYFSFWGLIFLGSMLGVIFSDNLISLYFFWEVAGLSSYRLIGFYREKDHLLKADKAFMITTSGAGIMFLSFVYLYSQTGTFSLYKMSGYSISSFIFFVFLIGVITKSATFPFHTWLPDASVAPTPVTAFLHAAVLVKIGVYGLLRIYWKTLVVEGNINWVLYLCVFSSLIAGVIALIEKDIKKILAYSTVSQLGFLLSGILSLNPKSIEGVLIFYIAHAIGKGGLFLTAGIIEKIFETKDITKMGGLMRNYPILTGGFLFSMLSVIGFPPFLGFFGKINIITGFLFNKNLICSFLLMLSSILTLLYMWRIFSYVFISRNGTLIKPVNGLNYMNFSVIICGFFSFFLGILYLFLKGGFFGY